MIYYALATPVLVAELLLFSSYASNIDLVKSSFQGLLPITIPIVATITSIFAQALPWVLIGISVYGLFTLRPALMVTLLTIFFLLVTSVLGQVDFYLAGVVVAASFTGLVGFSHARAAKILQGRKPILESRGPLFFRLTSNGLDLVLPVACALGVMALIGYVMGVIRAQVAIFPQPLSNLGSLYLQSHWYLVMTILTVAGGAVWAIRAVIEPVILRFTLTPADARELAYAEVRDTYYKIVWESSKKPSRGRTPFISFTILLILIFAVLTLTFGPSQSISELMAALGIGTVSPTHAELVSGNLANNIVRAADKFYGFGQDVLRFIIRILWG